MENIFQHILFQSVGKSMAESLFQGLCIFIFAKIAQSFTEKASRKYLINLTAQFAIAILFITTFFSNYFQPVTDQSLFQNDIAGLSIGVSWLHATLVKLMNPAPWNIIFSAMAVLYFMGILIMSIRWIFSWRDTQQLRHSGISKIDVHLKIFMQQAAGQMNIQRKIQIYLSKIAKSPMTIGFLKPVILLPIASVNHLTQEQLEAVILHELAHIQRADYLLNLLQSFAELILFFNPFAHILSKNIHLEREKSCDDWVMQYPYQPALYANALLKIARLQQTPALALSAAGKQGQLKMRVQRLFNKPPKKSYKLLACMIVCLVAALFLRMQITQQNKKVENNTSSFFKTMGDDGLMKMRFSNIKNTEKDFAPEKGKSNLKSGNVARDIPVLKIDETPKLAVIIPSKSSTEINSIKNETASISTDDIQTVATPKSDDGSMHIVFQSVKLMLDSLNKISNQLDKSELTAVATANPMQFSSVDYTFNTNDSAADYSADAIHKAIIYVTKMPANTENEEVYLVKIIGDNGKIITYSFTMKEYQ